MKRIAGNLTFQVLCAVALGALLGAIDPPLGRALRPVGDTFVKLVKMVIGPIISFCGRQAEWSTFSLLSSAC